MTTVAADRAQRARSIAIRITHRVSAVVSPADVRSDAFLPAIASAADAALAALLKWESTGTAAAEQLVRDRADELVATAAAFTPTRGEAS